MTIVYSNVDYNMFTCHYLNLYYLYQTSWDVEIYCSGPGSVNGIRHPMLGQMNTPRALGYVLDLANACRNHDVMFKKNKKCPK